jgi:hypothetical protein
MPSFWQPAFPHAFFLAACLSTCLLSGSLPFHMPVFWQPAFPHACFLAACLSTCLFSGSLPFHVPAFWQPAFPHACFLSACLSVCLLYASLPLHMPALCQPAFTHACFLSACLSVCLLYASLPLHMPAFCQPAFTHVLNPACHFARMHVDIKVDTEHLFIVLSSCSLLLLLELMPHFIYQRRLFPSWVFRFLKKSASLCRAKNAGTNRGNDAGRSHVRSAVMYELR